MCSQYDDPTQYDPPITQRQRDALRLLWRTDAMIPLDVYALDRDCGTVVVFRAQDDDGCPMLIAVDHRAAQAIVDELAAGVSVPVMVEPYQVLGEDYGGPAA
jgi:hypothetical protein